MERVKATFDDAEYRALVKLSEQELRSVAEQVRAIVRTRLLRAGLLAEAKREAGRCN